MLKELSKYNNLGTPRYFNELFSLLNKNKNILEQDVKDYFFNKTIDNKQIFDGCLPLLVILGIINLEKIKRIITISSIYKEAIISFELIQVTILEAFLVKYKEDNNFLNIFINFVTLNKY